MNGVPNRAKEIYRVALEMGFKLIRKTGKSHLVFAKDGIPGFVVTSATPRNSRSACSKVKADCRRLIERAGHESR